MNLEQRKLILNSFITSHFSYCPLVWMFHSRKLNNKINSLHERALRIIYQDFRSSFSELLNKDNSRTVHQRNLQKLVIELFKVKIGVAPEIMNEVFQIEERPYNFRNGVFIRRHNVRTVRYGTETVSFLAPKLWALHFYQKIVKTKQALLLLKKKLKIGFLTIVHVEFVRNMSQISVSCKIFNPMALALFLRILFFIIFIRNTFLNECVFYCKFLIYILVFS